MSTENNNKDNAERAYGWLASLLTGWGLEKSWAQYIAAAVVGAVVAVLALAAEGCTVTASQSADGSWSYSGEVIQPIVEEIEISGDDK